MKIRIYYLTLSLALFLVVLSCSKSELAPKESQEVTLSPEELLDLYVKPAVIFHITKLDAASGKENGWIVDRKGAVRSYSSDIPLYGGKALRNEVWVESEVEDLLESASDPLRHVDANQLLEMYHKILLIDGSALSDQETTPGIALESTISVLRPTTIENINAGGCGSLSDEAQALSESAQQVAYFEKLLVESTGGRTIQNTSLAAREIAHWITDSED